MQMRDTIGTNMAKQDDLLQELSKLNATLQNIPLLKRNKKPTAVG